MDLRLASRRQTASRAVQPRSYCNRRDRRHHRPARRPFEKRIVAVLSLIVLLDARARAPAPPGSWLIRLAQVGVTSTSTQ